MIMGGRINCYCPGPCPICSAVTTNMVLCDDCKREPLPTRPHPKKCQNCGRWECTSSCLAAAQEVPLLA